MKKRFQSAFFTLALLIFFLSACGSEPAASEYDETVDSVVHGYEYDNSVTQISARPRLTENVVPFPSLHITTYYDPFTQDREFWHDGTVALTGALEEHNFEAVDARFRGRGNSTWWRGVDKRPLRIRFREPQPLMSDYVARDWILLANQFDRSLLRNYSALYLGHLLDGLGFTPTPHHVHLYVNDEYMGVYLLTDERNVGPGRMSLEWHENPALSDFFLELDARAYRTGVPDETFVTVNGLHYDLRYPDNLGPGHVDYVRDYLSAVSYAIRRQSFDQVLALIDLDSFVDFYIVQEFYKDVDARDLSTFMFITGTGEGRRLFKGPIWDFDLAAGNAEYQPLGYGPEGLYVAVFNYWYRYLMNRPEFFEAVQTRWNEIRHREVAQTIQRIGFVALRYQAEFERNFERHPDVMGREQMPTPQEILDIDNFLGHVLHLVNWLETRANWLDDFFNGRLPDYDHMWALVEYQVSISPITFIVNGEQHVFNIPPVSMHNRVLLALQELEAIFGLDVDYDLAATGLIELNHGNIAFTHQTGDLFITVNGVRIDFAMPTALLIRNYIFVPLHVFADALGHNVSWDGDTRTVFINFES